jgi:hypothetical protein
LTNRRAGIDVNAKREIYTLIVELARSGLGIVMVSSETAGNPGASPTRIIVLCEGPDDGAVFSGPKRPRRRLSGPRLPGGTPIDHPMNRTASQLPQAVSVARGRLVLMVIRAGAGRPNRFLTVDQPR